MITPRTVSNGVFLKFIFGVALVLGGACASQTNKQPDAFLPPPPRTPPNCSDIPTCAGCQLRVNFNFSGVATGTMTSMPQSYVAASVIVNPTSSNWREVAVGMPGVSVPFADPVASQGFMPVAAQLNLYYMVPGTVIRVCEKHPLVIVH